MPEYAVSGFWGGALSGGRRPGPSLLRVRDGVVESVAPLPDGVRPQPVSVLPGVVDRHVHLGLVDAADLADSPVVEVHDLGWEPQAAMGWRARPPSGVRVAVAGPFHTAPGGYPSGRSWAPDGAVRAVDSPAAARLAVAAALAAGYDLVKVALHADMALLDDATLGALVAAAHDAGLPVAVHAEGAGQAARAIEAGADLFAHAPFSERLPDELLRRGLGMTWCSTLAIHARADRERALDNVRRFRALGGRVAYGTDAGNGPAPAGVNPAEIRALGEAGLAGDELLAALTSTGSSDSDSTGVRVDRLLVSPRPLPGTAEEAVAWLADCRRFTAAPLEENRVH